MFTITTNDPRVTYEAKYKCFVIRTDKQWPSKIELVSHKTGVIEVFEVVEEEAMNAEFWDGEMLNLRPHNKSLDCCVTFTYTNS